MPTIFADANKRPRTPSDANILFCADFWTPLDGNLVPWPESNSCYIILKTNDKKSLKNIYTNKNTNNFPR
jgi:hypothetical protein